MRRGSRKRALTIRDIVLRNAEAARGACGTLRLSKQGVYAISNDGNVRSFQVIRWAQMLKTLVDF